MWALGPEGLTGPGLDAPLPARAAAAAGGVGVAWQDGLLRWTTGEQSALPSEPTALALDPRTATAWALAGGNVWRITPGDEALEVAAADPAGALGLSATHEALVVEGAALRVFLDEQALEDPDRPPLALSTLAFLETPRTLDDPIACEGPQVEVALSHGLRRAAHNRALLETLPGAVGVALTARFAEAALHCNRGADLAPWGAWDPGLLVHGVSGCADAACAQDYLTWRAGRLRALGLEPGWMAGLSEEPALDPFVGAAGLGLDRLLFTSAGLSPDIALDDALWKQPWPLLPGEPDSPRTFTSLGSWPAGEPGGAVALYPGNTLRGFALGACEGLLALECIVLSRGSDTFDPSDALALGLLARHAVARRGAAPSSWSWHLPDLSAFDYTEGCVVDAQGYWTADAASEEVCEAAVLQDLLWDLELSLVANGVAVWARPSELEWPG